MACLMVYYRISTVASDRPTVETDEVADRAHVVSRQSIVRRHNDQTCREYDRLVDDERFHPMPYHFLDIALTPSVRTAQAEMGVEELWKHEHDRPSDAFTDDEIAFIETRDSFYLASVSESGWPYVQHRGGRAGFLKVIDQWSFAFADYHGNRQYISAGNFAANDRACLFLMDYARRGRLKIFAHVKILSLDADPALTDLVSDPSYKGKPERIYKLQLEAFDWNCSQHINQRYTAREVEKAVAPLQARLQQLETENAALKRLMQKSEI
jgi:predicted pyridoxine 5'-phosphate oxidase superfamily flavin-nucleotide-binding protein